MVKPTAIPANLGFLSELSFWSWSLSVLCLMAFYWWPTIITKKLGVLCAHEPETAGGREKNKSLAYAYFESPTLPKCRIVESFNAGYLIGWLLMSLFIDRHSQPSVSKFQFIRWSEIFAIVSIETKSAVVIRITINEDRIYPHRSQFLNSMPYEFRSYTFILMRRKYAQWS